MFPRGHIRDVAVDNRDVRLTVFVFAPGERAASGRHIVEEGDFQGRLDRPAADIAPKPIQYLAYDLCRFVPPNGASQGCAPRYYIGRPSDP